MIRIACPCGWTVAQDAATSTTRADLLRALAAHMCEHRADPAGLPVPWVTA